MSNENNKLSDDMASDVPSSARTPAISGKPGKNYLKMLLSDGASTFAVSIILIVICCAIFGPVILGATIPMDFSMRNAPPQISSGWQYLLGGDNLGRSLLIRLIVGARTTIAIAASAVLVSMVIGSLLGIIAGYREGLVGSLIMRGTDIIMSFPSLLMALIVLFLLGASATNLIIVLAIARTPVYLRTVRAEVIEIKRRQFVAAARTMGAKPIWIVRRHLLPVVLPTILTIASVDFAAVIIAESGLSFLGLGIQPPEFTWGAMVASGRAYINTAWWLSFFPGLAITLTTISLTLLSNWLRLAMDPNQSWRFVKAGKKESRQ